MLDEKNFSIFGKYPLLIIVDDVYLLGVPV